jgi:hypothetical protein
MLIDPSALFVFLLGKVDRSTHVDLTISKTPLTRKFREAVKRWRLQKRTRIPE